MAQFYGLPMASLRAAAWRRMLEGGSGFDVRRGVGGSRSFFVFCACCAAVHAPLCPAPELRPAFPPGFTDRLDLLTKKAQVASSVKLYEGAPLPEERYPLYYDQVHPWGPTGHRCGTVLPGGTAGMNLPLG